MLALGTFVRAEVVEATFRQTTKSALLAQEQVQTGRLHVTDQKVTWEYLSPKYLGFIMQGNKVTVKTQNGTTAESQNGSRVARQVCGMMSQLMQGKPVAGFSQKRQGDLLVMTPNTAATKHMLRSILVTHPNRPTKIVLTDMQGTVTTILLSYKS